MSDYFAELLRLNPWLLYVMIFSTCLLLPAVTLILLLAAIKGRSISLGPISIGPKVTAPPMPPPLTNSITQNPIQNVLVNVAAVKLSREQMDELADNFAHRVSQIRSSTEAKHVSSLFMPPALSKEQTYLLEVELVLDKRLSLFKIMDDNSPAGETPAIDRLTQNKQLLDDIVKLREIIDLGRWEPISPRLFRQAEYLAYQVMTELDTIFDNMPDSVFGRILDQLNETRKTKRNQING